jgi:hypothetical protein
MVLLTLSAITYLKYPRIFLDSQLTDKQVLINTIELRQKFIPAVIIIYFIGQAALLIIGFIRIFKKANKVK